MNFSIMSALLTMVNSRKMCFSVVPSKREAVLRLLEEFLSVPAGGRFPLNALQSLVGKIQSFRLAAPMVSLFLRAAYENLGTI